MNQARPAENFVGSLRRHRAGLQQLFGWWARPPRAHGRTDGVAVAARTAKSLVGATLASQGGPVAAVATVGGAARRQSRKYLFTRRLRKFIASRREYQLSVRLCNKKQHISSLRLEFSILSNKNASAAPHIPSAVSAHRSLDAPPRQDRSRAALRLQRQPSARPTGGRAGLPSAPAHCGR